MAQNRHSRNLKLRSAITPILLNRAMKFAWSTGFWLWRIEWCNRHVYHVTGSDHSGSRPYIRRRSCYSKSLERTVGKTTVSDCHQIRVMVSRLLVLEWRYDSVVFPNCLTTVHFQSPCCAAPSSLEFWHERGLRTQYLSGSLCHGCHHW